MQRELRHGLVLVIAAANQNVGVATKTVLLVLFPASPWNRYGGAVDYFRAFSCTFAGFSFSSSGDSFLHIPIDPMSSKSKLPASTARGESQHRGKINEARVVDAQQSRIHLKEAREPFEICRRGISVDDGQTPYPRFRAPQTPARSPSTASALRVSPHRPHARSGLLRSAPAPLPAAAARVYRR